MKIAYSGHRYIADTDLDIINDRMMRNVRDPEVEEMYFGGAIGVDSHSLRFAYLARGATGQRPILTVVCPDTVATLPSIVRSWSKRYADRFVELGNPIRKEDGWRSFTLRNEWMVEAIRDCGQLEAFWHGRRQGGTWDAIDYAMQTFAAWEHIPILGAEPPLPR